MGQKSQITKPANNASVAHEHACVSFKMLDIIVICAAMKKKQRQQTNKATIFSSGQKYVLHALFMHSVRRECERFAVLLRPSNVGQNLKTINNSHAMIMNCQKHVDHHRTHTHTHREQTHRFAKFWLKSKTYFLIKIPLKTTVVRSEQ